MTLREDKYIPAQPGLRYVELDNATGKQRLEPLVAWLVHGSDKEKEIDDGSQFGLWPVTPGGAQKPGMYIAAILFEDGRVYEPGHDWHVDLEAWVNDPNVRKRIRARSNWVGWKKRMELHRVEMEETGQEVGDEEIA